MEIQQCYAKEDDLPSNVSTLEQLELVPSYYRSKDPRKPLQLTDKDNTNYSYALKPMIYSVIFILIVEALERFSYYGINFTQTAYLTGVYDKNWSANLSGVDASSMTSLSTAIAYSSPFVGAVLADALLGDFWVIALGTSLLYIPGMILIACTTIPGLLGETFNLGALRAGLVILYPLGAGSIKAVVNIFGAKQFHPVLQSAMLSRYYINFYMFINMGALIGGLVVPIIAQHNVTAAYFIPVGTMAVALLVFILGAPRYVHMKPDKTSLLKTLQVIGSSTVCCQGFDSKKASNGGTLSDNFVQGVKHLLYIIPITALVVPFNVVYSQMATTFIVQGTVMKNAGFIDASMMQNIDAISVLFFGFVIGQYLYPFLEKRGIDLPTTHKFAMGTSCAVLACVCALIIEYQIRDVYMDTGDNISILWQAFAFFFIGAGEIFAVSAAYEAAYKVAPKEQKALASAINLFFIGGIPNYICMAMFNAATPWFTGAEGNGHIESLESYTTTSIQNYWWLLIGIGLIGCLVNVLPWTKNWVATIESTALESLVALEKEHTTDPEHAVYSGKCSDEQDVEPTDEKALSLYSIDDSDDESACDEAQISDRDAVVKESAAASASVDSWQPEKAVPQANSIDRTSSV
jgi:dipeptide/tripeptide permease